jgi:hypothetical protein
MCAQNLTSSLRYHGEDKHRDEVRYLSSRLLSMLTFQVNYATVVRYKNFVAEGEEPT